MVIAVTGGGASAVSSLLSVPGASGTIIEALIPYDPASLAEFLGKAPANACSGLTARQMAMAAYQRARKLVPDCTVAGVGCTAALATNRERRGEDRCHIAVQTSDATIEATLPLSKTLTRDEQEDICSNTLISFVGEATGVKTVVETVKDKGLTIERCEARDTWAGLLEGAVGYDGPPDIKAVFPGAFNPIHEGHRRMISVAEEILGHEVCLEISISNVDKPPIDFIEMQRRQTSVKDLPLAFSNAPTFAEKARHFPGAVFVVGTDTVTRIDDVKYYADAKAREAAIEYLRDQGNRFLVFGRSADDTFQTLDDVSLSEELASLCDGVPESTFRVDVSSSEIRGEA